MNETNNIKETVENKLETVKTNKAFKIVKNVGMVVGGVALGIGASYLIVNGHGDKVVEAAQVAAEVASDVVPEVVETAI